MRKFILTVGCFVTTLSLAQNSFIDNDYTFNLNDINIKGEVESVKTTTWSAQQEEGEIKKGKPRSDGEGSRVELDHFNKSGILIKTEKYGIDNVLLRRSSYLINKDGKLIEKEIFSYVRYSANLSKETLIPIIYHYDKKNKLIERIRYDPDKDIRIRDIYIYDNNGIISETIGCYSSPPCFHSIYEINEVENSVLIKSLERNSSELVKYDTSGNKIENSSYENGIMTLQIQRAFDVKGNLTERAVYHSYGKRKRLSVKFNFTYDQNDNITKEIEIRFNENGVRSYDEKGFTYKYDLKGNWVERIEYENNLPKEIQLRELNYYK
jgi:hypothetical protein